MWSDWLVFCDCCFQSVCPLMEKDRGLWKLPDGRDWLGGKLGLVLMGGAILSKSLNQFSVDGQGCFPPCCLIWSQTMVEVMKIKATSFRRSHALVPQPAAATVDPCLCRRLLDTQRQVWVSLLGGHCSFLLGPGVHKILFVPSKNLFPQSCVSSGGSMLGLMLTSSKRAWAISGLLDPEPLPWWQATSDPYLHRRHSDTVLAQSLWGLWVHTRFVWALLTSLALKGFDPKHDFAPPIILLGLLLCPWMWVIFFFFFLVGSNILQSMIVQQPVVVLEVSQEKMSTQRKPSICLKE